MLARALEAAVIGGRVLRVTEVVDAIGWAGAISRSPSGWTLCRRSRSPALCFRVFNKKRLFFSRSGVDTGFIVGGSEDRGGITSFYGGSHGGEADQGSGTPSIPGANPYVGLPQHWKGRVVRPWQTAW